MTAYAHSRNDRGERHELVEHLSAVARLAATFAEPLPGGDLLYWAGLWHDLGKFHPEFQAYLLSAEAGLRRRGPDHKGAGSLMAERFCQPLALLIQGHHGGLGSLRSVRPWLAERRAQAEPREALTIAASAMGGIEPEASLPLPALATPLASEFALRLLFSALVDADFLDTEQHFNVAAAEQRGGAPNLTALWQRFLVDQETLTGKRRDSVGRIRHEVYQACVAAAEAPPGFFRLAVPTGGGKTRSGLAFALRHALHHDLRRIIVAIPYTSITDQTAATYRAMLGDDRAVLEHHSAVQRQDDPVGGAGVHWHRLAAENWDAPIIVTTTVQLFESLFGHTPTACRKLHNLARSVIILDEAQTLPTSLLRPIMDGLTHLVADLGVSVVLSTATQPALDARTGFPGLPDMRDIIPEPEPHFAALARVRYECPAIAETWEWERVAQEMAEEPQCLVVLNTKQDALALLDVLGDEETLHLSTLLCGAHRRAVLAEVRRRLDTGHACRLVATQVVEAGVDLDFPVVFRVLGPLDRIIQAAGRCNREGRQPHGRVVIFEPAGGRVPSGDYHTGTDITRRLLRDWPLDLNDPAVPTRFFERLYGSVDLDAKQIQRLRQALDYPAVAQAFRMIADDSVTVVVPYQPMLTEIDQLCEHLRAQPAAARVLLRRLQPYTVGVARRQLAGLMRRGLVAEIAPELDVWRWYGAYNDVRGIGAEAADADALVV